MSSLFIERILQVVQSASKEQLFTDARAQLLDLSKQFALPKAQELLKKYTPNECIALGEAIHTQCCKQEDYTSKTVALYAHYSPTGTVNNAVCHAIQHLASLGYDVIFISDNANNNPPPNYPEALIKSCSAILTRSCTGYDFTSWKAAFERFPSLYHAKECLLTNDSIFFPIGSAAPIHDVMNKIPCDFWGLVASAERCHHVQSYYLILRRRTLQHPCFAQFINNINTDAEKMHSVFAYEISLTLWLAKHGLLPATFIPLRALPKTNVNPTHYFWRWLMEDAHVPLIKRDLLRNHCHDPYLHGWQDLVTAQGYDPKLIEEALQERKEINNANITSP